MWTKIYIFSIYELFSKKLVRKKAYLGTPKAYQTTYFVPFLCCFANAKEMHGAVFVHYHVPKVGGSNLLKFWYSQSRCRVFDVRSRPKFEGTLSRIKSEVYRKSCTVIHIHGGTGPSFVESISDVWDLESKYGRDNVVVLLVVREPQAHYLSWFNFGCIYSQSCGDEHELENFLNNAPRKYASKYLLYGLVWG